MIPILYEKTETAFTSNGLGRLRDCISCVVTEERNGVYECDFEYPLDGAHFKDIKVGRIIGVTHDETGDIQPFDIVSYERPIDGVVTFHCTHISYRLSYYTVSGYPDRPPTLGMALAHIFTFITPECPFRFGQEDGWNPSGTPAIFDFLPHTVRSMMGGTEGSLLDTYGGEWWFDVWRVSLRRERGQSRDFKIRYGVNMLDYNEEYTIEGAYSACIPYWTDGTKRVRGDRQVGSTTTITDRGETVPLDVSDKFESQPTKAQVEAEGRKWLNNNNPALPVQTINVEFIRDTSKQYINLQKCSLCDTIEVIFPDHNASGRFKIVKVVWDVLSDKYESMELGSLSTSLAEALGISSWGGSGTSSGGGGSDLAVTEYSYNDFTYGTAYSAYATAAGDSSTPYAIKYGHVVTLGGAFKRTGAQSSAGVETIGKVPAGCEPKYPVTAVQQGSGQNKFRIVIMENGDIRIERYGVASNIVIPNNAWINIGMTYISAT